jgi:hypothetical protein
MNKTSAIRNIVSNAHIAANCSPSANYEFWHMYNDKRKDGTRRLKFMSNSNRIITTKLKTKCLVTCYNTLQYAQAAQLIAAATLLLRVCNGKKAHVTGTATTTTWK